MSPIRRHRRLARTVRDAHPRPAAPAPCAARSLLVVVGPRALVEEVGGGGVRKRLESAVAWCVGG